MVVKSVIVGCVLGALASLLARFGRARRDPEFSALTKAAGDRYLRSGVTPWLFARTKLRTDPVYRHAVTTGLVPMAARLLDIGCGQGLLLAIVAAAREVADYGSSPADWAVPPRNVSLVGVERRPRIAQMARGALAGDAIIHTDDVRVLLAKTAPTTAGSELIDSAADSPGLTSPGLHSHADLDFRPDVVALFDVLHLMSAVEQERLLEGVIAAIPPGGRLLVREADAAGGSRFRIVQFGNLLIALAQCRWRSTFHYRTAGEWQAVLGRNGLQVDLRPMGTASFANVLLVGTKS